jgi:hypothetical protein
MPLLDPGLLDALRRAHEGDPDGAGDAFTEDAVYVDETEDVVLEGLGEIIDHLAALGGRRERFLITGIEGDAERVTLSYDLCFQADAVAFAQRGTAVLEPAGDRIRSWRCRWSEVGIDRCVWES